MLPAEKESLLTLFADQTHWCQGAEARDDSGKPVHYNDPTAVAWDITGGMCALFGWQRSLELFPQLDRHIHRIKRNRWWVTDPGIASMAALQDTNDTRGTTFEMFTEWIKTIPVWNGRQQQEWVEDTEAPSPDPVPQ